MANYRRGRINDEVVKEVASVLREVKDPRVRDAFVSVTGAEVTPDLKYAKIYYSALSGDEKELRRGLKAASVFIRGALARRMNLRITPELTFIRDTSLEYGARISSLLNQIESEHSQQTPETGNADDSDNHGDSEDEEG